MLQPFKYLHCVKLMEAGLANSALDYVRVLADYVVGSVAGRGADHGPGGVYTLSFSIPPAI